MMLTTLTGWMLIGGSIAAAYCLIKSKKEDVENTGQSSDAGELKNKDESVRFMETEKWCDTIEKLMNSSVIVFDSSMRLVAAGGGGRKFTSGHEDGTHLVDLVPQDCMANFVETAAEVRRGKEVKWKISLNGSLTNVFAASVGEHFIIFSLSTEA